MTMLRSGVFFFLLLFLSSPPPLVHAQSCRTTFFSILESESSADISQTREYIICPNTQIQIGIPDANGQIADGDTPLVLRSNAVVKCGADGSSANNCGVFGGQFAVFMRTYNFFGDLAMDNIVVQGLTFRDHSYAGDIPVLIQHNRGSISFIDIIHERNSAAPNFLVSQHDYDVLNALDARSLADGPQIDFSFKGKDRRLIEDAMNNSSNRNNNGGTTASRNLQQAGSNPGLLQITVKDSLIAANVHAPFPDGDDYARFRFNGGSIFMLFNDISATFDSNIFRDNYFPGEGNAFGTLIYFESVKDFVFTNNCLENNVNSNFGAIYMDNVSPVVSQNYVNPPYDTLSCPLIAVINIDLSLNTCGPSPDATECPVQRGSTTATTTTTTPTTTTEDPQYTVASYINNVPDPAWVWWPRLINATAGLPDFLNDPPQQLTMFTPDDTAMETINQNGYLEKLITPEWILHRQCLLGNHLVAGQILDPNTLVDGQSITTVSESALTMGANPLTVNSFPIATTQQVTNGWVYVLSQQPILQPCISTTALEYVTGRSDLSRFLNFIIATNLGNTLSTASPVTLFAPTDDALSALPLDIQTYLVQNLAELTNVLLGHMIPQAPLYLNDAVQVGSYATMDGNSVSITIAGGVSFVVNGNAQVLERGNLVKNGVVHIVDQLVLPVGFAVPTASPTGLFSTPLPTDAPTPAPTTSAPVTAAPTPDPTPAPITPAPIAPTSVQAVIAGTTSNAARKVVEYCGVSTAVVLVSMVLVVTGW